MKTQTKNIQDNQTPKDALKILKDGNNRFVQDQNASRNLLEQVKETSNGQFPFAAVLSCIDSRVPVEHIFDLGVGDIFSARVAGNIINDDILGSLEYSCKVAGSKILVVLGHTKCGAVTAACKNVELGNITTLLSKIKPAVDKVKSNNEDLNDSAIEEVSLLNIQLSIDRIREESPILAEMEKNNEIEIVGALYHVANGKVDFFEGN